MASLSLKHILEADKNSLLNVATEASLQFNPIAIKTEKTKSDKSDSSHIRRRSRVRPITRWRKMVEKEKEKEKEMTMGGHGREPE